MHSMAYSIPLVMLRFHFSIVERFDSSLPGGGITVTAASMGGESGWARMLTRGCGSRVRNHGGSNKRTPRRDFPGLD